MWIYICPELFGNRTLKKNMVGNSFNSTVTERARLVRVKKKIAIKLFVCCILCRSLAAFSLSQQKSVPWIKLTWLAPHLLQIFTSSFWATNSNFPPDDQLLRCPVAVPQSQGQASSRALQVPLGSVVRSALSRLIAFSRVVCFFHPKKAWAEIQRHDKCPQQR